MNDIVYNPPPSLAGFLACNAPVSFVTGPVGSGKSSASMIKIAYHAKQMRKQRDGIRRSRAVIVRNTRQMLSDATFPTFNTWFPDGVAGQLMKTDFKFLLKFDDVECEVLFRGLDDANDVRRLLSLEVSFGVIDEFREIHPDIFNALQGRVGRYPSKLDGGCVDDAGQPNYHVWGASNAPDADTFWEKFLSEPPKNAEIFMQPSALSPEADWLDNLVDGYYENLAEGKEEAWVNVYIHNKFGESLAGKPVFRSFNSDLHVAKDTSGHKVALRVLPGAGLIIGVDAGLSPAAVIGQIDYTGRLIVHDALISESMGALRFIREKLKPLLANKFPGIPALVVIDPAAFQRVQTDERCVADIFRNEGFTVRAAKTNVISARLAAVDNYLTRMVDGKPSVLFDAEGTAPLLAALRGKYRYKVNTKGETAEKPEKSHPWSDVADAFQYLCLHGDSSVFAQPVGVVRDVQRVSFNGWT